MEYFEFSDIYLGGFVVRCYTENGVLFAFKIMRNDALLLCTSYSANSEIIEMINESHIGIDQIFGLVSQEFYTKLFSRDYSNEARITLLTKRIRSHLNI